MSILVQLPRDEYQSDAFNGFTPVGFSIGTARAAAWLAQLVYEDDDKKITAVANDWQLQYVAAFRPPVESVLPIPRTRGIVLRGRGAKFIAFAGTDPLVTANWVTDFDFALDAKNVHQGFATALDVAWAAIAGAVAQNGSTGKLFIVGHSLGAALAVLCANRILNELSILSDGIYTFGLPRVAGKIFAGTYNGELGSRTYRFVYGGDIVPTVPPSDLGFMHVGRLIRCKSNDTFDPEMLEAAPSDVPKFAEDLLSGLKDGLIQLITGTLPPEIRSDLLGQASRFLPPAIGDHLPDRYWKAASSSK